MSLIIFTHVVFAICTLFLGVVFYLPKYKYLWEGQSIFLYLYAHMFTAFTGFFLGGFGLTAILSYSPFKVLSAITIFAFVLTLLALKKKNYERARSIMLGTYIGLCIAFVGTLFPLRIIGSFLFFDILNISESLAIKVWQVIFAPALIIGIYFIIKNDVRRIRKNRINK